MTALKCFYFWVVTVVVTIFGSSGSATHQDANTISLEFITNTTADDLRKWEAPEELKQKYSYYLSGFDYDNRPIWIMEMGQWNFKDVVEAGGKKLHDFDKYLDQAMYRMVKSVKIKSEEDFPVTDFVLLVNLDKFDLFSQHSFATLRYFLQRAPKLLKPTEHLELGFFVNVSYSAERLVNVMRQAMGGFFSKMEVYGTNKQAWQPKVLKEIPADQLPKEYGGTKTRFQSYSELANEL